MWLIVAEGVVLVVLVWLTIVVYDYLLTARRNVLDAAHALREDLSSLTRAVRDLERCRYERPPRQDWDDP
jgi:hypothetical protein